MITPTILRLAWLPIIGHLKDSLSVTAFDLPGHGMSQDWDYSSDYQDSCLDISATFINKPVHLVGHSFGATVALRVAHRYPNFVKSLSLIEPVFFAAAFADYYNLKDQFMSDHADYFKACLLYTSPSPRDMRRSRMPSSA